VKLRTFFADIGTRGGAADVLYLSGFNVDTIVVSLLKVDAGTTGVVYANSLQMQYFQPVVNAVHDDGPKVFYGWFPADGGLTAHESISGAVMTVTGGTGITIGNVPGAQRYQQSWGSLAANSVATLGAGFNWVTASEVSNVSWTWLGWVYYNNASTTELYIEMNAAVTSYAQIVINPGGTLGFTHAGTLGGTASVVSAAILPVAQWVYLGIVWTAATAQLSFFVNGAAAGAALAWARATTNPTDRIRLNGSGSNQLAVAGIEIYNNVALSADDIKRHMRYYQNDIFLGNFLATTGNIQQNNTAGVVFSNAQSPGFDASSYIIRMPLSSIMSIQTGNGVFVAQIDTYEREVL
jgi:hypothetical protein